MYKTFKDIFQIAPEVSHYSPNIRIFARIVKTMYSQLQHKALGFWLKKQSITNFNVTLEKEKHRSKKGKGNIMSEREKKVSLSLMKICCIKNKNITLNFLLLPHGDALPSFSVIDRNLLCVYFV